MGRTLGKDGVNLAFTALPELRSRLRTESERQARRQDAKGAELRGPAYLLNSLACYFLSLDKAEQARMVDVGRAIFNKRLELEEDAPFEIINLPITVMPRPGTGRLEPELPPPKAGGKTRRNSG